MIVNLGKKALLELAVPLAKCSLPKLATKAASYDIDKFESKISRRVPVRARNGFTSNEDRDHITKIEDLLENLGLLIDGPTETIKHEIRKSKKMDLLVL